MKKYKSILLFCLLLPLAACIFDDNDDESLSFLFVESFIETNGVLISGTEPPLLQIDFPTYRYDEDMKTLNGIIDFEINKGLKFIYGSGTCLSGTAGGGCATGLIGVYEVPYEYGAFELLKIEDDGTIRFIYKDEVFSLGINEEHSVATTYMDTANVDGINSISEITSTLTISNFGFINEEDVTLWEW